MITTDDIVAYFEDMHGHPPFPWQLQLAEAALEGSWPDAVDAPTGLGKTWAIDIANRSLLSDFLGVQTARAAGLHVLGAFGPLRRLAMREGLAPSWRR